MTCVKHGSLVRKALKSPGVCMHLPLSCLEFRTRKVLEFGAKRNLCRTKFPHEDWTLKKFGPQLLRSAPRLAQID